MWIETVSLDDFGCFDAARLAGLEDGVNVVAGPQRAGKTTFMHALRHLGYRIPRDGSVPPPTNEYDLSATVQTAEGTYRIDVTGYADPTVSAVSDAPERTALDLYGDLQQTQYHQLYTLSLDELRQSPRHLDDDVSLAEVLLGGAYGDVAQLPHLRDEFASDARDIGGKHGRAVYELGDPMETIERGIEEREDALDQVDEYEAVQSEIDEIEDDLADIDARQAALAERQAVLESLAACFDEVERFRECRGELADVDEARVASFPGDRVDAVEDRYEDFTAAREAVAEARRAFDVAAPVDDTDSYLAALSEHRADLERFGTELSGYRERHETLQSEREAIANERASLRRRAADLNDDWAGDLDAVRAIGTDRLARDEVQRITSEYETAVREYTETKRDVADTKRQISSLRDELETARDAASDGSHGLPLKRGVAGAALSLVGGLAAGVLAGAIAGVLVTFLLLLVTGALVIPQLGPTDDVETAIQTLESDVRSATADLERYESQLADRESRHDAAAAEFERLCEHLGVPDSMSPDDVQQFYDDVCSLQADLQALDDREAQFEDERDAFASDVTEVADCLVEVGVLASVPDDVLADGSRVFSSLEQATEHVALAEDVLTARAERGDARERLVDALDEWEHAQAPPTDDETDLDALVDQFRERAAEVDELAAVIEERDACRQTIRAHFDGETTADALVSEVHEPTPTADGGTARSGSTVDAVTSLAADFEDRDAVEDALADVESDLADLEDEEATLRERLVEKRQERDRLRSADDVRAAHETIQQGRRDLVPLAEEYAVNRLAEHVLDELYERYIERTTGPLLDDAGRVFERLTAGEYGGVETSEDLDDLDFVALLANGDEQVPDELSRATVEQLFLAIRIARIRRADHPLPVILDDSFTNFDPRHRRRTLQVVNELASENQVFLLTCHPEIVDAVAAGGEDPNYWRLDDGVFDGPVAAEDAKRALQGDPS